MIRRKGCKKVDLKEPKDARCLSTLDFYSHLDHKSSCTWKEAADIDIL